MLQGSYEVIVPSIQNPLGDTSSIARAPFDLRLARALRTLRYQENYKLSITGLDSTDARS